MVNLDLVSLSETASTYDPAAGGTVGDSSHKVEIIRIIDEEESGLGSAGKVAIVLVVAMIIVTIMCIIFCRFWKKETDDHFQRQHTIAIKEKKRKQEEEMK